MWISDYSIRRPVTTVALMLALVTFGGIAVAVLDTDEFPEVNPPVISVAVPYPGASPATVEREVIDPMEEAYASISGVDEIESTASDGFGLLIVTFDFAIDPQQAAQDVRDELSEIRSDLPVEMEEPVISRFDPNDLPIMSLALWSDRLDAGTLTRIADPQLTGELRSIPGVAEVTVLGGVERALTVELRPEALQASGVAVGQVVEALLAENLAAPVGSVISATSERTLRLRGRLDDPAEFAQLVVASGPRGAVRLGDVATVADGTEEPRSYALYGERSAVGMDIVKATGHSTTAVAERVRAAIERLRPTLPEGAELSLVRDAGVRVERSVSDVRTSLIEGAGLTVLVVFLFLVSWRSTVITGLTLPVSVLASFIAVWAFGFTLNTMSLLGLSLAIGILIDDAIVVRENIVRHLEMGKDHVTAAREGTSEIGLAVTATTLSIVVVFLPIAFMGGIAEQWMGPFALTIAASVLVSLGVSFSLDPMLSAHWADPVAEPGRRRRWLVRPLLAFNRWFDRQTERYQRMIGWALRHRLAMIGLTLASFAGALALPATGLVGSEFFPVTDRSELQIQLEMPPGSSLEYSRDRAAAVARLAERHPEVRYTFTTVGQPTGGAVDQASVYARLVPRRDRTASQDDIGRRLRADIRELGGVDSWLAGAFGPPERKIQVQITGPDLGVLDVLARRVAAEVARVPGAADVGLSSRGRRAELEVAVDRSLAASLGVSMAVVAQSLRAAFASIDAGRWIDPDGETRDVIVRLARAERVRPEDVESLPLPVTGPDGARRLVPLRQIADVRPATGPAIIEHRDRQRMITVGANTEGRALSAVVAGIMARVDQMGLPPGYAVRQGGETEDQQEVFGRMLVALAVAVLLMYVVLVIQFDSFVAPIAILISLPLSLIGVMLAMLVTGSTLNLMSMIGVVLLMGIVAKNAILLIDFARKEEATTDRETALVRAGAVRLRPIVMTSVAIIAGMLPVAMGGGEGGDFRAPLGRAVIGGVITATALTLLVIPTVYDLLANAAGRLRRHRVPPAQVMSGPTPSMKQSSGPSKDSE